MDLFLFSIYSFAKCFVTSLSSWRLQNLLPVRQNVLDKPLTSLWLVPLLAFSSFHFKSEIFFLENLLHGLPDFPSSVVYSFALLRFFLVRMASLLVSSVLTSLHWKISYSLYKHLHCCHCVLDRFCFLAYYELLEGSYNPAWNVLFSRIWSILVCLLSSPSCQSIS